MNKKNISLLIPALLLFSCQEKTPDRPNIILIMADDLGFSDLGCTGAEIIKTPNIDYLAESGIMFNQFFNASRCAPTRASLLTGQYAHTVHMGWMTASDLGHRGYAGDLDTLAPTIAEVLRKNGYATYMTGKWHVTLNNFEAPNGPKHNWPTNRGFEKYFGQLSGGGGYYNPKTLTLQDKRIDAPEGFYLTNAINEYTVDYLEEHFQSKKEQPFFLYLAHYAPHFPLHALKEDIDVYRGRFLSGWDSLRMKRYQNQLASGLIEPHWELTPTPTGIAEWESLPDSTKTKWDAKMAVYAAQIHRMDLGIGMLINTLQKYDQLDNTLIIFISDNGATNESIGNQITLAEAETLGDNSTYISYREPWAHMSNTPFSWYKSYAHQGGIVSPFIAFWPAGIPHRGKVLNQQGHVIDFMPTFLELAGASYPKYIQDGRPVSLPGVSLLPALQGNEFQRPPLFFEHESNRAIIDGEWKLVAATYGWPRQTGDWELYHLKNDPTEIQNVIQEYPEIAKQMEQQWTQWAEENHVFPLDTRGWNERINASVR